MCVQVEVIAASAGDGGGLHPAILHYHAGLRVLKREARSNEGGVAPTFGRLSFPSSERPLLMQVKLSIRHDVSKHRWVNNKAAGAKRAIVDH